MSVDYKRLSYVDHQRNYILSDKNETKYIFLCVSFRNTENEETISLAFTTSSIKKFFDIDLLPNDQETNNTSFTQLLTLLKNNILNVKLNVVYVPEKELFKFQARENIYADNIHFL